MTSKEYKEERRTTTTSQQINLLLEKAAESFLEGRESIILKLPNKKQKIKFIKNLIFSKL